MQSCLNLIQRKFFAINLICCLVFTALSASAQQYPALSDEKLYATFEKFQLVDSDKSRKEYDKELEKLVDEMMVKLDQYIALQKKEQELAARNYKPKYSHGKEDMNLFPLWEEIPGPVPSLPEAKRVDFKARYDSYIDKVERVKKDFGNRIQQDLAQNRTSEDQMKADAYANANRNPIVQQMGGAEAIANMSDADRKKAAKAAAAGFAANPGAGLTNDEGTKQFMQKLMSDPAYREKYNKMTDAQKEAEVKKFTTGASVARDDKAFEAALQDRNSTLAAINQEKLVNETLAKMIEATKPYSQGTEMANEFFGEVYRRINDWYNQAYEALPETVANEKIGHDALLKCRESILYLFYQKEAATRTILWTLLKNNTKIAMGEFNDYIGQFGWGKEKNMSMVDGKYLQLNLAKAVVSVYDEMIRLTTEAKLMTSRHKGQQETYETVMSNP